MLVNCYNQNGDKNGEIKNERTYDISITIDQYSKEFFHMLCIPQNIQNDTKNTKKANEYLIYYFIQFY